MKKLLILFMIGFSLGTYAQEDNYWERIKALKVSFFTEELKLSPEDAQKFWPIYNAYDEKMDKLRYKERKFYRNDDEKMSDSEASKMISGYNEMIKERTALENKLLTDLDKIFPSSMVVRIPGVEKKFSRRLFEEWKKRRKENE